jgi:hypothetical protein
MEPLQETLSFDNDELGAVKAFGYVDARISAKAGEYGVRLPLSHRPRRLEEKLPVNQLLTIFLHNFCGFVWDEPEGLVWDGQPEGLSLVAVVPFVPEDVDSSYGTAGKQP